MFSYHDIVICYWEKIVLQNRQKLEKSNKKGFSCPANYESLHRDTLHPLPEGHPSDILHCR